METKPEFRDSQQAFADAIKTGKLTTNQTDDLYAGHWMYMCTVNGEDQFKNIQTRQYLRA